MAKERSEVDSCGHEHVTEELLERLLASTSIEGYLSAVEPDLEGRDLAEYLRDLLERKGLGLFMRKSSFALVGAILYAVAMVLFPMYFFFVVTQTVLSFVGFSQLRKAGKED